MPAKDLLGKWVDMMGRSSSSFTSPSPVQQPAIGLARPIRLLDFVAKPLLRVLESPSALAIEQRSGKKINPSAACTGAISTRSTKGFRSRREHVFGLYYNDAHVQCVLIRRRFLCKPTMIDGSEFATQY